MYSKVEKNFKNWSKMAKNGQKLVENGQNLGNKFSMDNRPIILKEILCKIILKAYLGVPGVI